MLVHLRRSEYLQDKDIVVVKGTKRSPDDEDADEEECVEIRLGASRVTLEDESAPGVSSSSALPYAKC